MDPELRAFFQAHPKAMTAFDDLAGKRGQNLEAAMSPKGFGFDGSAVVRYIGGDPIGLIHPDGTFEEV